MPRFLSLRSFACHQPVAESARRMFGRILVLAFLLHPVVSAADGVVEINHACASQTGCFPGDLAGYPVTIDGTAGRNYRLSSDLAIPMLTDGVVISANRVRLDLAGFAVISENCSVPALGFCLPPLGPGAGIRSTSGPGVQVSGGSVIGMNGDCIALGDRAVVSNVRVGFCGGNGIQVGRTGRVVNSTVEIVAGHGIETGRSGLVTGNAVYSVSGNGIELGISSSALDNTLDTGAGNGINAASGAALITRNSISRFSLRGIFVNAEGSTVSNNTVSSNDGDGIRVTEGSHVIDNTVFGNTGNGIVAFGGSSVQRNAVRGNDGVGLSMSGSPSYRENVVTNNAGGTVVGGVDLGSNSCNSTTSCP